MTQHFPLDHGAVVHQGFFDPIQEMLSAAVPSLRIEVLNSSTLRIVGGTGNDQVSAAINGKYRFVTTTITATLPGGLTSGVGSVYITAADNNFGGPVTTPDSLTNYTFAMEIRASGTPSTALYRKVGEVDVSGSAIVSFRAFGGPRVTSEFGIAATPDTASQPGLLVTGRSSQTGNLILARNSSGNTVFAVTPDGGVTSSGTLTLTGATTANRTLISDGTGAMNLQQVGAAAIQPGLLPPTGSLMPYAGASSPTGWLICNGGAITSTSYPDLHTVLANAGYPYGGSGGSANLPDLRGRVPVGLGTHADVDALGDNEGATSVGSRRPAHGHSGSGSTTTAGAHGHTLDGVSGTANVPREIGNVEALRNNRNDMSRADTLIDVFLQDFRSITGGDHSHSVSVNVGQTSSAPTDEPAYITLNYIIKT